MNNSVVTKIGCRAFYILIMFIFSSCERTLHDPPIAKFTYSSISSLRFPATVQFTNTSTVSGGSATYVWEFGDGTTSTVTNPPHIYTQPAVYTVRLIQTPSTGLKDTVMMILNLATYNGPSGSSNRNSSASFTFQLPARIYTTTFANGSTGADSYLWKFGDGTTSTTDSVTVTHVYNAGTFHVNLTATNSGGADTTGAIINF